MYKIVDSKVEKTVNKYKKRNIINFSFTDLRVTNLTKSYENVDDI